MFKKRLKQFYLERTSGEGRYAPGMERYVPRATGEYRGHWRVYDRAEERFLTDKEAKKLGEALLTATMWGERKGPEV